jgi:hypothetical protein
LTIDRRSVLLAALAGPAGCANRPGAASPASQAAPVGEAAPLRAPRAGQWWTYRQHDLFSGAVLGQIQETVVSVASTIEVERRVVGAAPLASEIHARWGQLLQDPAWDHVMSFETPVPLWPVSLSVGARASVQTHERVDGGSIRYWIQVQAAVRGWERVVVAAGAFDSLRIERLIRLEHPDHNRAETQRRDTLWLAPGVGRWVLRESAGIYYLAGLRQHEMQEDRVRWELTAWQ